MKRGRRRRRVLQGRAEDDRRYHQGEAELPNNTFKKGSDATGATGVRQGSRGLHSQRQRGWEGGGNRVTPPRRLAAPTGIAIMAFASAPTQPEPAGSSPETGAGSLGGEAGGHGRNQIFETEGAAPLRPGSTRRGDHGAGRR
jgi:hypothetical protein